ncbi:hypothetical protein KAFR_0A04470 [Kazachstania africana CBS 2517]|uniref:CUE domain-containing protein n=1 Tax=Kazachstania africana (strain ATCC 22294 / BCRC 22015 / CBS 2517 / CECT 1963 / NBRC 1671 / NRRL Y-8276) TaxID=1071382 RepID=H2AND2_KAZAF|nr:hypothetical protein KAFR_0A04470 [Kazachstania africana CBS 2517]CCF55882.1 hypothetical protein KAFR_0A04470 [Kazachstania africana CBS 2517]
MSLLRRTRILTIDGDTDKLHLPIVKFPPFKLRGQLIEKDPVVWVHLLETYITFLKFFVYQDSINLENLDESTHDHFIIFVKSYIDEISNEEGKLLSLGMNSDVATNLDTMKKLMLQIIKNCGLSFLQIFGETLWNLVKLYVNLDPDTIKLLIGGSWQPRIQSASKLQPSKGTDIQNYLKSLIENNKFTRIDLKALQSLVANDEDFVESNFLNAKWFEILESLWGQGHKLSSTFARQLAITTVISVSSDSLAEFINKDLRIENDIEDLKLYPLLGSVLLSQGFTKRKQEVLTKIRILNIATMEQSGTGVNPIGNGFEVNDEDVDSLSDLFPDLSRYQIVQLLQRYDSNIELITNLLFEDPSIIEGIPREEPEKQMIATEKSKLIVQKKTEADATQITKKHVPDEIRNKTLTRALKLLYQNDEDERDDTYDEAEAATTDLSVKVGSLSDNEEGVGVTEQKEDANANFNTTYDKVEGILWNLLKENKTIFARSERGSKFRKQLKSQTNWSDEQIEGWARMLEKSPQRARILEEKFMFRGNVRTGKTSYVKNREEGRSPPPRKEDRPIQPNRESNNSKKKNSAETSITEKKKKFARNEKNKASRANHNRKSGHDKKLQH